MGNGLSDLKGKGEQFSYQTCESSFAFQMLSCSPQNLVEVKQLYRDCQNWNQVALRAKIRIQELSSVNSES